MGVAQRDGNNGLTDQGCSSRVSLPGQGMASSSSTLSIEMCSGCSEKYRAGVTDADDGQRADSLRGQRVNVGRDGLGAPPVTGGGVEEVEVWRARLERE